jgi:hypothetical protein
MINLRCNSPIDECPSWVKSDQIATRCLILANNDS